MAGGKKINTNTKAEAGRAQKAENEAKKQAEEDRKKSNAQDVEWKQGANNKKTARDEAAAQKADEATRKRREKEELLAAEEAELGAGGTAKKPAPKIKKKAKPKSGLALMEDALVKAADKKVKKSKEDVVAKRKKEQDDIAAKQQQQQAPMDPLLANTAAMIGDDVVEQVGRNANKARMEADDSGIDAALGTLNVSAVPGVPTQAKSAKALYNEYEARTLPVVKDDYPGLRLTQYKEKVWNMWKKSSENPANQVPVAGSTKHVPK
jgi:hypothetical protein